MKRLEEEVINFFQNQGCVIVSTVDKSGFVHCSCKGIVEINRRGKIYLFDLYKGRTLQNLENNRHISITAIDEHKFVGYCLKGKAKIVSQEGLPSQLISSWEDGITHRLTLRLLKNIHEVKGHPKHPEVMLPKPKYMILMQVEEIVDLTPHQLK